MSSSSVKGLMKGLRYISQMFEREKEEEIEIGFPTDVKHVAHIGNDGSSSSNTPSWMNEFKGCSDTSSAALRNGKPPAKSTTRDSKVQGTRDIRNNSLESPKRGKKKQSGSGSPLVIQKPRRNKPSNIESPGKKQNLKDPNVATKPTRRKKKGGGSAGEGSTRSRSKVSEPQSTGLSYSDPGSCKGEVG